MTQAQRVYREGRKQTGMTSKKSRGIEEETWVMIRKYKIYIIMGITVFLLFMVLPVDTKGDWEIPWDITLEGEGNDPAFRSSTVMEIFLKNGTAPKGCYNFS